MARIRDELRTSEWCAPIGRSMVGPINGRSIAGPMVDRSISWPVDWRVFSNKIPQSRAVNYRGRRHVRRRNEEFLLRVKNSPLRLTVKALAVSCSLQCESDTHQTRHSYVQELECQREHTQAFAVFWLATCEFDCNSTTGRVTRAV